MSAGYDTSSDDRYRRRPSRKTATIPAVINAYVVEGNDDENRRRESQGSKLPLQEISSSQRDLTPSFHQHLHRDSSRSSSFSRSETPPKVKILPGSLLNLRTAPPEPKESVPVPSKMIRFLITGDRGVGKSNLVSRFFNQQSTPAESASEDRIYAESGNTVKQHGSSGWSVNYHKKDVSFWHPTFADEVCCARVQIWEVSGGLDPTASAGEQNENIRNIVQKATIAFVVASVEDGLEALAQSIQTWKGWFAHVRPALKVVPLITKCDLLPSLGHEFAPEDWIRYGTKIEMICRDAGIGRYHLTSCRVSESTASGSLDVCTAFMAEIRDCFVANSWY